MSERDRRPARVGVRELRQNLSVYLRRVKGGETLEVTERGQPVARLEPARPEPLSPLARMIAEGRAMPARRHHGALGPPPPADLDGPSLSDVLRRMRDEERW